jgi:pimeloyl-ACP methyl ester carboxylesterase
MNTRRSFWLSMGVAAGAAAAAIGGLLWRSCERRQALARCLCHLTQEAVAGLGVPAVCEWIRAGDVELHAVIAGPEDGPLVLLLHGFPECWYSWRRQIPVLARAGYRVVAVDQRGYNQSDKPRGVEHYQIDRLTGDIKALIHVLGRERAVLVAHDWGGVVAWRFAIDYPEAVDRLVVMNAPHPVVFVKALRSDCAQQRKSWYIFAFQLPWLPEALLALSPMASARFFFRHTTVRRDAFSDADLEVMAAALAQPGAAHCMLDWYRAAFRFRAAGKTRDVEAPTLLIWAEDDVALSTSLASGLERGVRDLRVHFIPDCGHWVQNEAPDEVNEQLLAFLQERPR